MKWVGVLGHAEHSSLHEMRLVYPLPGLTACVECVVRSIQFWTIKIDLLSTLKYRYILFWYGADLTTANFSGAVLAHQRNPESGFHALRGDVVDDLTAKGYRKAQELSHFLPQTTDVCKAIDTFREIEGSSKEMMALSNEDKYTRFLDKARQDKEWFCFVLLLAYKLKRRSHVFCGTTSPPLHPRALPTTPPTLPCHVHARPGSSFWVSTTR